MGDLKKTQKRVKRSLVELLHQVQSSVVRRSQSELLLDQLLEKSFQVALKKKGFDEQFFSEDQIADYFQYAQYYSRRKIPHLAARYFLVYCHGCWLHPDVTQESFSLLISIFSLGMNLQFTPDCLRVHQEIMKVISLMRDSQERQEILIPFYLQKWRVILKKGTLWQEWRDVLELLLAFNPNHEVLQNDWLSLNQLKLPVLEGHWVVRSFPGLRQGGEFHQDSCSKSIFDSSLEQLVYHILVKKLPEYLILPNHPVANLFVYDQMRELLSPELFHYFHKSRVDYCIISRTTFKPVMGVELDGPDHEHPKIQIKDELKREIFRRGGVPLLRLKCPLERDPESIAEDVFRGFLQRIGAESA